ncbi:helix-turn-helix domain-containing protein [Paenibacillus sp. MER 78]
MNRTELPRTIIEIRKSRQLTVAEAAKSLGLHNDMLLKYEREPQEIPLSVADRILRFYEISSMDQIKV